MDNPPLKTLVVDDEPLATERLQLLLARIGGVDLVGTASDGEAACRMAEALSPDLLLLDIAMPGMDGIDVARELGRSAARPAVVFVTAFDHFAVSAFEVEAVDYLVKPVDPTRLERALERARAHLAKRGAGIEAPAPAGQYLDEFWASDLTGLVRIRAIDIDRVSAERDYMQIGRAHV